jgi:Pyridine nucleotide-disulphide oxidoreductase, dimerisation domain
MDVHRAGLDMAQWRQLIDDSCRGGLSEPIVNVDRSRGSPGQAPLPMAEGSMLYGFTRPERTGFQKCVIDPRTRQVVGTHHAGYGSKDAFQYLHYLISRPAGLTIDELGDMNELYLSADYFIGYARLRSGQAELTGM